MVVTISEMWSDAESSTPISRSNTNNHKRLGNDETTPSSWSDPGFPRRRSVKSDTCYSCGRKGHWASDCPAKLKNKSEPSVSRSDRSIMDGQDFPEIECPCGAGDCRILTSRTEKNPGRKFYRCPDSGSGVCNFFRWCDEVTFSWNTNAVDSPYPMCICGAGKCRLLTENNGRNAGRMFFGCPVKKGQGACSYVQWLDSPGKDFQGDEVNVSVTDAFSQHSEQRVSLSSGPFDGEILDTEASEDHIGVQSESVVSNTGPLSPYNELPELRVVSYSSSPSEEEIPDRDASGAHFGVQSGSESGDSLAGSTMSPRVEEDEDYMSDILLSTARHFANNFLKRIQGLSIPSFLRQRNQLVEAIHRVTSFGVNCTTFVSQIDYLIQLIDDFQAFSFLAEQGSTNQRVKDQLCSTDSEDARLRGRIEVLQGKLRIVGQAEGALVAERADVLQALATITEDLRRLASERQQLLAEMAVVEEAAAQSQQSRAELQEQIEQAEQEQAEILAALETDCQSQEELLEQLRISLGSLRLWD